MRVEHAHGPDGLINSARPAMTGGADRDRENARDKRTNSTHRAGEPEEHRKSADQHGTRRRTKAANCRRHVVILRSRNAFAHVCDQLGAEMRSHLVLVTFGCACGAHSPLRASPFGAVRGITSNAHLPFTRHKSGLRWDAADTITTTD